jgi:serine/threonine protein kinase
VPFSEVLSMDSLHAGSRLGAYRMIREIGRGGMGTVWLGERDDGIYHGQVAIKILSLSLHLELASRDRFTREGEILAKLTHPNIARLLDAGVTDAGVRYLVLEYVDGVPITRYCQTSELSIDQTLHLFCQALDAVAYAHSLLILHRDIKPGNVLVTQDGTVKLLDFGLGKLCDADQPVAKGDLTRFGGLAYTPRYAPPEQMRGDAMSTASDVYSLGVTLYEVLTGATLDPKTNYTRPSEQLAESQTRGGWSKRVRGDIDAIVAKAVSEAPKDRYVNASAMKDDLMRFLTHQPVTAQRDSSLYRTGKFIRRHRVAVGSTLTALLVILASLGISVQQTIEANNQRTEANRQKELTEKEVQKRDKTLVFVTQLISNYAPRNAPLTTVQLLDIGMNKVSEIFKDDYVNAAEMAAILATRFYEMDEIERARDGMRVSRDYALKAGDAALIVDETAIFAVMLSYAGDVAGSRQMMQAATDALAAIPDANPNKSDAAINLLFNQIIVSQRWGDAAMALDGAQKLIAQRLGAEGAFQNDAREIWNRASLAYHTAMRFSDEIAAQEKSMTAQKALGIFDAARAEPDYQNRLYGLLTAGDPGAAVKFIEAEVMPKVAASKTPPGETLFWSIVRSYSRYGDRVTADKLINERTAPGELSAFTQARTAYVRFEMCIDRNDAACAHQHAQQAADSFVRLSPGNPAKLAGRQWVRAADQRLSGNDVKAQDAITEGLRELSDHKLSPSQFYAPLLIERAKIELKRGDAQSARATAQDGLAYIKAHYQYDLSRCVFRGELLKLEAAALDQLNLAEQARLVRAESDAVFRATLHPDNINYPR